MQKTTDYDSALINTFLAYKYVALLIYSEYEKFLKNVS